jgi:hypothetical protein
MWKYPPIDLVSETAMRGPMKNAVTKRQTHRPGTMRRKRCHAYLGAEGALRQLRAIRNPLKRKKPFTAIPPSV